MPGRRPLSSAVTARNCAGFALIAGSTLMAYLPAMRGRLLWDDEGHITRPDLQSLEGLWRIWTVPGATQQYYPLLHTAFWAEHALWSDSVLYYHLVNVTLHALAACLVVAIVRRLALPGAWLAGLWFALHPLSVESVAWISEQKSTLSGAFYLAAALAYLRFDESRRWTAYVGGSVYFVAALLSKSVTAVLPAVLLVLLWWRRGSIEWKRDVRPLLPWFAVGAAAGLFTAWAEAALIGAKGAEFALTPIQRVLLAGRAIWFYAGKVLWPANLTFFYPRWEIDAAALWQHLFPAAAIGAGVTLWLCRRSTRGPLAACLIFAGTLFPVLGFLDVYPFRYSYVADHFAYLASLAILIPLAAVVSAARPRGAAAGVLIAAALGFATWKQSAQYRDAATLYRATLERNPSAWLAHNNLANLLLENPAGRPEAIAHLESAIRLKPEFPEAHLTMGNALLDMQGRLADAINEYRTAVRLAPGSERAHTNLGNALMRAGKIEEAMGELQQALRIDPANAEAHNDLGNVLARIPGRLPEAIEQYRKALSSRPGFPEAHNNLGRALAGQPGGLPEAIAEFEAAIRLRPDYWSAHSNLGNALSLIPNRLQDAVAEYRMALRLQPDSATVHNNLGYALSKMPQGLPGAIAEYREAVRLDPQFADAHFNLAAALAQTPGNRAEAIAELDAVRRLRPGARIPALEGLQKVENR
jgi:tetratricopeptide (TPR) repeat protein